MRRNVLLAGVSAAVLTSFAVPAAADDVALFVAADTICVVTDSLDLVSPSGIAVSEPAPTCAQLGGAKMVTIDTETGRIVQGQEVADNALGVAADENSTVIGIDWDYAGFNGSTLVWTTNVRSGCRGGRVFRASQMPRAWNNRVGSAQGYQDCHAFRHFEWAHFGDPEISCYCSQMYGMDNATSSVRFYD